MWVIIIICAYSIIFFDSMALNSHRRANNTISSYQDEKFTLSYSDNNRTLSDISPPRRRSCPLIIGNGNKNNNV